MLSRYKKITVLCSMFLLISCSASKAIEKEYNLLDASYENFNNQNLQFYFSETSPESVKVSVRGTTDSCSGIKVDDESKLKLYVDFSDLKEGNNQAFPIYIKYGTIVCDFDVNPSNAYFDVSLK